MEEEDGAEGGGGRAGKVLVLKVLGFGIPALDALQEVLPVLRVLAGGEAGADLGGTEEVLHFSVRRPPPPPLDNMVDVQSARSQHRGPSSSLQRSAMRRPAPIDTSQYAYRSPSERSGGERGSHGRGQPRQTSPRRSGCRSPDARSLAPSPVVLPIGRTDSRDSMPSASNPFGTLDLIWQEIFLTGLDQETLASRSGLQLVVECRDPRDRSLLSSTPQISLDTLIVHRPGLQRREVLLTPHVPHNGGMRDVSWEVLEEGTVDGREPCPSKFNLSGRGMGCVSGKVDEGMHISVGALGGGGQLEMEGRVLDAHDAARRAVAFRLARETRLFDKHLDEQDAWGDTPLLRACRERKLVRTRTLLAAGADVSICNHEGETAAEVAAGVEALGHVLQESHAAGWTELMLAAARRRMPQLLKLLSNSTPLEDRNLDGHTAFALAALHGHVDVMASLVAHKAVLDTFCNAGTTPLMQAAGRGDERVAKWLLENGAAVNMRRGDGRTAIFDATLHAHAGVLKLLLAYSASLHVRARDTSTPLVAAVLGGSACRECAGLLLEAAADVNVRFELTECSVALMRSRSNIRAMHNVATFRVPAGQGEADVTPLMYAAWKGHETTVQRLLAHKADVDARSHSGSSPLLGAVGNGHLGVVALLLEHDADLGQADKNGISPLDEAANLERSDIHKLVQLHAGLADLTMVSRRKFAAQREKRNNSRRFASERRQHDDDASVGRSMGTATTPMSTAHSTPRLL